MSKNSGSKTSLSPQETIEQIRIYQTSTSLKEREDAANRVVTGNEGLVMHLIYKVFPTYLRTASQEDLMQEGRTGIFEAMRDFDPNRGKAFATHASYKILHNMYVRTGMDSNSSIYYQSQARAYKRAVDELSADGIFHPSVTDIADKMGVGIEAVQKVMQVMARANHVSLDGDEALHGAAIDPIKFTPDAIAIENEWRDALLAAVKQLSNEQQIVIQSMFFSGDKPQKLTDIGRRLGRKPDEVKRIKNTALRDMRRLLTAAGFGKEQPDDYDGLVQSIQVNIFPASVVRAEMDMVINIEL